MKKTMTLIALALMLAAASGCDNDQTIIMTGDPVPATPQGVHSITNDGAVIVLWNGIYEDDVKKYVVYRSVSATTGYTALGSVAAERNPNLDLVIYNYRDGNLANGDTYYYAVTAVDYAGQESELSAEDVWDTPRPEGFAELYPIEVTAVLSGFNFASGQVIDGNEAAADVWLRREIWTYDGDEIAVPYLEVGSDQIGLQDMGHTVDFDDISFAPTEGWLWTGAAEVEVGHTYVIVTASNHFAKLRVTSLGSDGEIEFYYGYQEDQGNIQLAPGVNGGDTTADDENLRAALVGALK